MHFSFLPWFIELLWLHHMPDEVCVLLHTMGDKFSSGGFSQEKGANGKLEKCNFSEKSNWKKKKNIPVCLDCTHGAGAAGLQPKHKLDSLPLWLGCPSPKAQNQHHCFVHLTESLIPKADGTFTRFNSGPCCWGV